MATLHQVRVDGVDVGYVQARAREIIAIEPIDDRVILKLRQYGSTFNQTRSREKIIALQKARYHLAVNAVNAGRLKKIRIKTKAGNVSVRFRRVRKAKTSC